MDIEYVCGKTGYIDTGYGFIGVYRSSESEIILFDTGNEYVDEIIKLLDSKNLCVRAIVCTHLHYDHTANNNALFDRYKPEIFLYVTCDEDLEYLKRRTNLHYPYKMIDPSASLLIDHVKIEVLQTPGHCPGHLSFVTPDCVCCLGDAVISQPLLGESKLPYVEDVEQAILTMEDIRNMPCRYFIVSHKGIIERKDMPALIDANIEKEIELYDIIRRQITAATTIEDAITDFMRIRNISEKRIQESYSLRDTVRARILTLTEAGEFSILDDKIIPTSKQQYLL